MKAVINVKTEQAVKDKAQEVADEIGLSLSAVVNASLKQFIRSREVRFSAVPRMTLELEETIRIAEADFKRGKNISPVFSSAKKAIAYLHS